MPAAPRPVNETSRLRALRASGALSRHTPPVFSKIARAAARSAKASIGLVTFISADRQWVKASVGCDVDLSNRDAAFCSWAVYNAELLWVEDALSDPRFAENPLVLGEPNIRHYAGAPIVTPDGYVLGTVCVIDSSPRAFDPDLASRLTGLAGRVSRVLRRNASTARVAA